MRLLTLFLTRSDGDHVDDDSFDFVSVPNLPDFVRVTASFAAAGTVLKNKFKNTFVLPRAGAAEYALSLIGSLVRDDDPFEKVQISSAIFPTVIYRVENLEDCSVRTSIQDILYSTFNTTVE